MLAGRVAGDRAGGRGIAGARQGLGGNTSMLGAYVCHVDV